jgi:class III poly(R)-hydroxyalkanoic acid synthase PhaE subunit
VTDNSFLKAWTTAQQDMMKTWADMTDSALKAQQDFATQWQNLARQNVEAWVSNADSTAQTVARKTMDNQSALMNLLQMAWQTWERILPQVEAGGDWQVALDKQLESVRTQFLDIPAASVRSMQDMNRLWQTYIEQWQGWSGPWQNAIQQTIPHLGSAMLGERSALGEMTNLYWDAYQDSFGQLLQAPGIGYSREFDEKVRQGFAAWLDMQAARYEYQLVVANTWVQAFEALMHELVEAAKEGQTLSLRDFLNKWSTLADRIFKTAFSSSEYVAAQSGLVNAMMRYRTTQRQVAEVYLQFMDMPTRAEVDEAHRRIYELRKEVKALRKELKALTGAHEKKPATKSKKTTGKE